MSSTPLDREIDHAVLAVARATAAGYPAAEVLARQQEMRALLAERDLRRRLDKTTLTPEQADRFIAAILSFEEQDGGAA